MYKDIVKALNGAIELHKGLKVEGVSESEVNYFIKGLEMAITIVKQVEEEHSDFLASETFDDVVLALKDSLEKDEMIQTINSLYQEVWYVYRY